MCHTQYDTVRYAILYPQLGNHRGEEKRKGIIEGNREVEMRERIGPWIEWNIGPYLFACIDEIEKFQNPQSNDRAHELVPNVLD